jgi:hypothetical protein
MRGLLLPRAGYSLQLRLKHMALSPWLWLRDYGFWMLVLQF